MEFIPLDTSSKKANKAGKKASPQKAEKSLEKGKLKTKKEINIRNIKKGKPQSKVIERKKVKNKYREQVGKKRKRSSSENDKKGKKQEEVEDDEDEEKKLEEGEDSVEADDAVDEDEGGKDDGDDDNENEEDEEGEGEEEEEEEEDEETKIEKKQERVLKTKLERMEEKMKNRLFVKMNKKIKNEAQIKELHPDIRAVVFPRKKNSRWCWAVFTSQEKALAALKKLSKNREVLVTKPNSRERVDVKREKKLKTVQRKKEAKKKLLKMWT